MKLLGISPWSNLWGLKNNGGTPTLYNLIKGFVDAGNEVHLICPFDKSERIVLKNLYFHQFKLPFNNLKSNIKILNRVHLKILYFLFILLATFKALKITKKIKPDIIYGFSAWGAPVGYLIGKIRKVPNITRLFGISLSFY